MKKQFFKHTGILSLIFCCMLILGCMSAKAAEDETGGISVQGGEGAAISGMTDVASPIQRSSCGVNHTWSVTNIIQEGTCDKQGIYKVQCTICGAAATVTMDELGHNFVDGICTVCGERQGIEAAPESELAKWEYERNEADNTITLKKYISDVTDVIVYGTYRVDGVVYDTILNGADSYRKAPFYEKRKSINSVIIKKGVQNNDCRYLFFDCSQLSSLDVNDFETSNVRSMFSMFYGCSSLTDLDLTNFDTSNVTDMYDMFKGCSSLKNLDVSNFNTSNLRIAQGMFRGCNQLETLDLSKFDTAKVAIMSEMFSGCCKLKSLDLSNFDTSKAVDMKYMFYGCNRLENLDVSSFNTSNVTMMDWIFYGCSSLTDLDLSNFNTSKIVNMYGMFKGCSSLKNLDISNFDTSNVIYMDSMFWNCSNLTRLDLSSFKTSKVLHMDRMFEYCSKLASIHVNIDNWDTSKATASDMFRYCGTSEVTPK